VALEGDRAAGVLEILLAEGVPRISGRLDLLAGLVGDLLESPWRNSTWRRRGMSMP